MSPVAAFFDMDHTVIDCNSAVRYVSYLYRNGKARRRDLLKTAGRALQYRLAMIDAPGVMRRAAVSLEGEPEAEMIATCEVWFEQDIRPLIFDRARAAIERHRAAGHPIVLLTAATTYIASPVARHLDIEHHLATRLEVSDDGRFTGAIVDPVCYGAGKIFWAEQWSQHAGVELDQSYFYSDSFTDLPMLQRVGHPIAVNPDPRLQRHARRHDMPIERW